MALLAGFLVVEKSTTKEVIPLIGAFAGVNVCSQRCNKFIVVGQLSMATVFLYRTSCRC